MAMKWIPKVFSFFPGRAFLLLVLFPLLAFSCVSIPKEAPVLSVELGKKISSIEDSHISLLRKYMDEKRSRVDEFIMKEWVPLFAREVFSEEVIKELWGKVCASGSEEDRLQFLTLLGPKLQRVINQKRVELIRPLDDLEKTIERKLRDEYTQAKAINNSISSFLVSAAEVAENRDRLLNMMGVTDEKIARALDETDKAVAALVSGSGKAVKGVTVFKENMDKIMKEIKR